MSKTILSIDGDKFLINGQLTYSELPGCRHKGILMNARFIQGIFDDGEDSKRFSRFGRTFDPSRNTEDLVRSLPEWYEKGLRGITVGFQGGGPCFTTANDTITNHPYVEIDGKMSIDDAYGQRMLKVLEGADAVGMVVIVSCFYPGQVRHFKSGAEIVGSVKAVCDFINRSGYRNVILEICNEFDLCRDNPIIGTEEGMSGLITMAQEWLKHQVPVGSSLTGGSMSQQVARVSDVVLVHGNGCSPQDYHGLIDRVRQVSKGKPILCNEDSPCIGNMLVSMDLGVGWGYYNNMTKQEPPADWSVTLGEDAFFAERMAMKLGIDPALNGYEDKTVLRHYHLQGVGGQVHKGEVFLRVASLYPETIQQVEFFRNGVWFYTAYGEPFAVNHRSNWHQLGTPANHGDVFEALIHLVTGDAHRLSATYH